MGSRFFSSYYIWNAIALAVYPTVRLFKKNMSAMLIEDALVGFNREYQVFLLLVVILLSRFRKAVTMDLFLSQLFGLSKFALLLLLVLMDFRIGAYYAVFCFVLWMVLKQPRYDGPSKIIKITDRAHFKEVIGSELQPEKKGGKV